jgi:D-amino-acid dehydrogenase
VFARLGDRVRAAGLADIGPRAPAFDPARFETFRAAAVAAFGPAFDHGAALEPWAGGRPCTPSSRPVVGRGRIEGLFLNLGHGTLGWTLCLGSAARLMEALPGGR